MSQNQPSPQADDHQQSSKDTQKSQDPIHTETSEPSQAKDNLHYQHRLLEAILDGTRDILAIQYPDQTVEYMNKAGCDLLGRRSEDIKGQKCFELLGREHACNPCTSRQALESKQPVNMDKYVPELDLYFNCVSSPVLDEQGHVSRIVKHLRDISKQKRHENQLRGERDYLFRIFDTMIQYVFVCSSDYRIEFSNRSARERFGDLEGKTCYQQLYINTPCPNCPLSQTQDADISEPVRYSIEIFGRTLDGTASRLANPDGSFSVLEVCEDITDRKQAEEDKQTREAQLRVLVDTLPDLVWLKNREGLYLMCNQRFEHFFGARESEIVGKTDYDFVPKELADFFRAKDTAAMHAGKPKVNEEEITFAQDGHREILETIKTPMFDFDGRLIGVLGIGRDITHLKKTEQEKLQAQKTAIDHEKYALVGQIAGKMAHDFNNILTGVLGNSELALLDCPHEPTREALELILEQANRGKNLTRNLVAFAKDQEPKQEYFQVTEKIDLVLNLMKKDLEGIKVIRDETQNAPDILADPGMIEHALVNLIQNSIQAMGKTKHPCMTIRASGAEQRIWIEIEDNGCGIPHEYLDRIFEPAFTLKGSRDTKGSYLPGTKGTGYGMANVKKYVEQHKGRIAVESNSEQGTKVTISLPIIHKELSPSEINDIEQTTFHLNKSILVVEDEQAISDVYFRVLTNEPCKHRVDIAQNGSMAIDLFEKNAYDLISLDYILPGEINGTDVYRHIRKRDGNIPILFISGNLEFLESIKELQKNDPHVAHVSKPCLQKEYIQAIDKLFRSLSR